MPIHGESKVERVDGGFRPGAELRCDKVSQEPVPIRNARLSLVLGHP